MLERHEVISAYRLLLGREPESDSAIDRLLQLEDWAALRRTVMGSAEYKKKHPVPERHIYGPPLEVDVQVSDEQFSRLLIHVQNCWEQLGRERPHWSVLASGAYQPSQIAATGGQFFATGAISANRLSSALARAGARGADGVCLELGCGLGRVTVHLARRFKKVIAFDISAPHLALAHEHLSQSGVNNVELVELRCLEQITDLPAMDCFYSILVLQHNPPPLIYRMLRTAFQRLKRGGYALFQLPVYEKAYRFHIEEYLSDIVALGKRSMEMHILPQRHLFQLFENQGMQLLDLVDDGAAGRHRLSHQYLLRKS